MACMCGDPYCGSCGPAQGGHKCLICGVWNWDGGCEKPEECRKANELMAAKENEFLDQMERAEAEYNADIDLCGKETNHAEVPGTGFCRCTHAMY
jgi:hypothetical protein